MNGKNTQTGTPVRHLIAFGVTRTSEGDFRIGVSATPCGAQHTGHVHDTEIKRVTTMREAVAWVDDHCDMQTIVAAEDAETAVASMVEAVR